MTERGREARSGWGTGKRSGTSPGVSPAAGRVGGLLAVLLVVLLGAGLGCSPPDDPPGAVPGSPEEGVDPAEGLQFAVSIDRGEYAAGDPVSVRLQISNLLEADRTLSFRSSQRFDLRFLDAADQEVWRWSADQSFAQVLGTEELPPDAEGPIWEATIPAPAEPGGYRLEAEVTADGVDLRTSVPVQVASP